MNLKGCSQRITWTVDENFYIKFTRKINQLLKDIVRLVQNNYDEKQKSHT